MTKQLLVMRHAKSSWSDEGLTDFQRPLNKRGLRVAPQMAEFIHLQGLTPDLIVSSAASRAKMTAELFVGNCKDVGAEHLTFTKEFYHAPAEVYCEFVGRFADESVGTLLLVGHNPGLEDLVEKLTGSWQVMPTAAIAHFDLGADSWSDIDDSFKAKLKNLWRPKEIDIR